MFWVVMVHQAIDGACADVTTDKYQNSLIFSHVFYSESHECPDVSYLQCHFSYNKLL